MPTVPDSVSDQGASSSSSSTQAMEVEGPSPAKDNLPSEVSADPRPTIIIQVGMAGSGKSTLLHQTYLQLLAQKKRVYTINLDPAVKNVAYPCNIDIRDTIDYKEVMRHFQHGPNGAIMTSLNLFATRFDQVLALLDKRAHEFDYVLIDTPGQIEVFGWSASGQIIADSLAVSYPTIINYVIDTARCIRPVTFMSNMLYACSILYKMQLPFVLTFNKCDVLSCKFVRDVWMKDQSAFSEALRRDESTYLGSLSRSMSRVLEEFYVNLNTCGVSAHSAEGVMDEMVGRCFVEARREYFDMYLKYLDDKKKVLEKRREEDAKETMDAFDRKMRKSRPVDLEKLAEEVTDLSPEELQQLGTTTSERAAPTEGASPTAD